MEVTNDPKIRRGSKVVDIFGNEGIVVEVSTFNDEPMTDENHGTVAVWQSERVNHGLDNCEHYPYFNFERILTVLEF